MSTINNLLNLKSLRLSRSDITCATVCQTEIVGPPVFIITTPWLGKKYSINILNKAIKMPTKKAVQNPEILKPLTSLATSIIISALSASANKPNVSSVSGNVRIRRIGRSTALTKPNMSAEMSKDDLSENLMPLKT